MTAKPEAEFDMMAFIEDLARQTEPSFAIVAGSNLEEWLFTALKERMRPDMSKTFTERVFSGYGPLSSFSGKIDIAYAFGIFGKETYDDLRAIKDIRNAFAHSRDHLHFNSPELAPDLQKLTGWTKDCDPKALFVERIRAAVEVLKADLNRFSLARALRSYGRQASQEKSIGLLHPQNHGPDESEAATLPPPESSQA